MIEVFHKRQMLVGSSKKASLGAAVIYVNDLSSTIRDQWYPLYPAKNVQGRKTHSVGGDLLPVSGEVHVILNITSEGVTGDPSHTPLKEELREEHSQKDGEVKSTEKKSGKEGGSTGTKKKSGGKDVKTRLKTLLNTSSYAQKLIESEHPKMETSGLITSYVSISYTKDSFEKYLKSELENSPDTDLLSIPFPAVITEMYPFVDHNVLSPTIWAVKYLLLLSLFYYFIIICYRIYPFLIVLCTKRFLFKQGEERTKIIWIYPYQRRRVEQLRHVH